jgi:hypothetical protein
MEFTGNLVFAHLRHINNIDQRPAWHELEDFSFAESECDLA